MPRVVEVSEVAGVAEAIATADPAACVARVRAILAAKADRKDVVRTAALAAARHFQVTVPPPHALPTFAAALEISARVDPPELPLLQACALAASEWRGERLASAGHSVTGDELHLGGSFQVAVRAGDVLEADAIFTGLLRDGDERRLAGDALFEMGAQDAAGQGHKLTFAVGSWRLARALGWLRGPDLMRPAVHLAAAAPQDLGEYGAILREVGRARFDLELAGRNAMAVDQVARNAYAIALQAGPDRIVAELISGLKRGRSPAGYTDLVAATALERLVTDPAALEPALLALAARFVVGFSNTSARVLALLLAARRVAGLEAGEPVRPAPIADLSAAMNELEIAIEGDDAPEAARLALGLADAVEAADMAAVLHRQAAMNDATADGGHGLLLAAWATEFATVAPGPAFASLAAHLARERKSRTIALE